MCTKGDLPFVLYPTRPTSLNRRFHSPDNVGRESDQSYPVIAIPVEDAESVKPFDCIEPIMKDLQAHAGV